MSNVRFSFDSLKGFRKANVRIRKYGAKYGPIAQIIPGSWGGSVVEHQTSEREAPPPPCSVLEQDTLSSPNYW